MSLPTTAELTPSSDTIRKMKTQSNIFYGLKVIDLTRVFSGPFATRHFADLGAKVIKIEPLEGDDSRLFPPKVGNWSGYFEVLNRNKQSLFLNLKDLDDLTKLYELCKNADVFVVNYSAKVNKKLKVDYETVKRINPNIIYASICGVNEGNDKKYYDVIAQAESGLISLNGETTDMKVSTSLVDAFSGMKLAYAISSALYYREKTGRGQKVVVSMKGSAFDLLEQNLIATSVTKANPDKVGNMDNAIAPFGIFQVRDGSIALAVGSDALWDKFVIFLRKLNSNFDDSSFKTNMDRVKGVNNLKIEIENIFQKYTKKQIIRLLNKFEIPCGNVKKMSDVLKDGENFDENLLIKYLIPEVGMVVVPTGGVFFSTTKFTKYKKAPLMQK